MSAHECDFKISGRKSQMSHLILVAKSGSLFSHSTVVLQQSVPRQLKLKKLHVHLLDQAPFPSGANWIEHTKTAAWCHVSWRKGRSTPRDTLNAAGLGTHHRHSMQVVRPEYQRPADYFCLPACHKLCFRRPEYVGLKLLTLLGTHE